MEGFTIKCNKCGAEKVLLTNNKGDFREDSIDVFATYTLDFPAEVSINCECGTIAEESNY